MLTNQVLQMLDDLAVTQIERRKAQKQHDQDLTRALVQQTVNKVGYESLTEVNLSGQNLHNLTESISVRPPLFPCMRAA